MKVKYSVIIPHKNCPDLLIRCLNSIPERADIQIIVVDDFSDPTIVDFTNFPGLIRSNVQLIRINEAGRGAGNARNVGIEHSEGEWILFCDSDDFYEPEAFEVFDNHIDSDLDIIYFLVESRDSLTLEKSNQRKVISDNSVFSYQKNDLISEQRLKFYNAAPWNKIFNQRLIRQTKIRFDEIKINNDVFFALKTALLVKNFIVIKSKLYNFTFRSNSISTQKRPVNEEILLLINRIRINAFYRSYGLSALNKNYVGIFYSVYKRNGLIYLIEFTLYAIRKSLILFRMSKDWNNIDPIKRL